MLRTGATPIKICSRCKLLKDKFYRDNKSKDGLKSQCVDCSHADNRRLNSRYRDKKKNLWLKWKYGISLERFQQLEREQGGRCKICQEEVKLMVDHNHITGKVRGLLCTKCNKALGLLNDKASNCLRAYEYLGD